MFETLNIQHFLDNTYLYALAFTCFVFLFVISYRLFLKRNIVDTVENIENEYIQGNKFLLTINRHHENQEIIVSLFFMCINHFNANIINNIEVKFDQFVEMSVDQGGKIGEEFLFYYRKEKFLYVRKMIEYIMQHARDYEDIQIYLYDPLGIDSDFLSDMSYYSDKKLMLKSTEMSQFAASQASMVYRHNNVFKNIKIINFSLIMEDSIESAIEKFNVHPKIVSSMHSKSNDTLASLFAKMIADFFCLCVCCSKTT